MIGNPHSVHILLPTPLSQGFDYAVPGEMTLSPGDYVTVPFGSRDMPGVVWGEGTLRAQLKPVGVHHSHLPPMSEAMRQFIDWAAWYTASPRGAVLKMALPVPDALLAPTARERPGVPAVMGASHAPTLSEAQHHATRAIIGNLGNGFSVTLLDGVTGSGKTEVYFEAIANLLEPAPRAPQILVLLPEISLSVQWLKRFETRFGFAPHVWHSGLPPARRKHTWRAIAQGEARVVVGARSALFLPYRNLRLIVVDEEHEGSYKQEDGVMYHARDMAVASARFEKIPVVLASATPSLETLQNVRAGKYQRVELPARHGNAQLPDVQMIDMRSAPLTRGAFISEPLRAALKNALACSHQAMLFLNRRGYAPLVLCRACGHRFCCPECSAWLVLHKSRPVLTCHHCGYAVPEPKQCDACHAEDTLFPCGPGVERIAEEVAAFLPEAKVRVLASDSAQSYTELQECIADMEAGRVDVLIGTQMVAKGHHFANLALVGVVDADLGLSGGDLRAGERSWQLLHQLSGRAGRAEVPGRVLLQSFEPQHPVMEALLSGNRERFLALELAERERWHMPPFSRLAGIIVESVKEDSATAVARALAKSAPKLTDVEVLGPAPAPLYRLRGRFRLRLLVKAGRSVNVPEVLKRWMAEQKIPRNVKVKLDVDPYSFL